MRLDLGEIVPVLQASCGPGALRVLVLSLGFGGEPVRWGEELLNVSRK